MGQGKRTRRKFTDGFKRYAVELVHTTGKPIAQVLTSWGSTTPRWATGSSRAVSTAANATG
jgi:transposase-like protein